MMDVYNYMVCCFVFVNMVAMCNAVCPNDCYRCNQTSSYCETCNTGYYLSSNTCYQCSNNCLTCTELDISCRRIFCVKCSDNCAVCQHKTKCYICDKDFYRISAGNGNNNCLQCGGNTEIQECVSCPAGIFGTKCTRDCGLCRDSVCLKTSCAYGCIDGYYKQTSAGDLFCKSCNQGCLRCDSHTNCSICDSGHYLVPNTDRCIGCRSNCVSCMDYDICGTCVQGTWGPACKNNCSSGCMANTCNKISGICNGGCKSGYYIFNNGCAQCPSNCKNKTCKLINGNCNEGCIEGWRGLKCRSRCFGSCKACERLTDICTLCPKRSYGNSCNKTCSNKCVNSNCNITGKCIDGCITGYEGDSCDQEQNLNEQGNKNKSTQNKNNEQPTAVIAGAAGGGALLVILAICVVVFICVRRRKSKSETETQATLPVASTTEVNSEQGYIYAVPNKMMKTNTLQINNKSSLTANSPAIPLRLSHLDDQETDVDDIQVEEEIDDEEPENSVIVNDKTDPTGDTYYNVAGLKRSRININNLSEYVVKKTEPDFYKEFEKFPKGLTRPFTESRKPEDIIHNRYRSIYPWTKYAQVSLLLCLLDDATRVVLHDGRSDYINASYIDGYNQPKPYIASLGPTKATMAKFTLFWRMVWQEKVEKIVMLTNLVEGDKMKCEQYWPDVGNAERYSDVEVTCDSDDIYADLSVKRFSVSKNGNTRVLYHLHFTAWPDRSVPDDVTCLIEFRQKVENFKTTLGGPLIVHCSWKNWHIIGLDMLTKEGKAEGSVDIFGCVMGLRGQRISMVQTMEQYRYLHDAVVHKLTLDCDALSSDTFHMADGNNLQKQFERMSQMKEKHFNDEENAVKRNTKLKDKNRKGADIPGDLHSVVLHGRTEYINAVYINSYKTQNRYILAQTPLPGTLEDFLYMVLQENVSCIVTMDEDNIKDKTVGIYLPAANQTLKKGSLQIKATICESTSSYTLRKLSITNLKENEIQEKTVYHFQMNFWKQTENSPNDTNAFVELIKDVERTANEADVMSSIIVHCLTGAERSALFCVVSILIEKMNEDNVTSVVNTVRQIRARRQAAIPNLDQYLCCHKCVSSFLNSCNTYSNVI